MLFSAKVLRNRLFFGVLTLIVGPGMLWAQSDAPPSHQAYRLSAPPRIDGLLGDVCWQKEMPAIEEHFTQRRPDNGVPSSQRTRIQIAYDDQSLYVAARLYDTQPDSILKELGLRDEGGRNADAFTVLIDPYHQGLAAFRFSVSAAGVQRDIYQTLDSWDTNWDAVWISAVQIDSLGWTVELEIPYMALRFPKQEVQRWGINFQRDLARYGEQSFWSPTDANVANPIAQYGVLNGIEGITPPLRLSALPFISTYYNHQEGEGAMQVTGGMDLKYGINESFTLDVSLVPDFGQVRSDNVVLNLSPFEVRFEENRPFFTEGTELFNQGGLFYSRRIGSAYGLSESPRSHEVLTQGLPQQAPMLNATKLSGRTRQGTGLGFFNSLTNRTTVSVRDTLSGETREVQADPFTNFNVMVVDQNLRNNSRVSLVNTNVMRSGSSIDANVTGAFFDFFDKTNTWSFSGAGIMSQRFGPQLGENGVSRGHSFNWRMAKISGRFRFNLRQNVESDDYDINDLGFLRAANEISYRGQVSYRINEPFGIFNRFYTRLNSRYQMTYLPREYDRWNVNGEVGAQFRNLWWAEIGGGFDPRERHNHFEPRTAGYIFRQPVSQSLRFYVGTDRRKPFRMEVSAGVWQRREWQQLDNWLRLEPRLRINDHLSLNHNLNIRWNRNEVGFIDRLYHDSGEVASVVMGRRNVQTTTNTLSGSYNFNALMGMTLRVRHYWSKVAYDSAFHLTPDGFLHPTDYALGDDGGIPRHDRNFNAFNVDLVYNWQFAPGSMLTFVWKNAIYTDEPDTSPTFAQNLSSVLLAPQLNSLSLRLLYFLDYQEARHWVRVNRS